MVDGGELRDGGERGAEERGVAEEAEKIGGLFSPSGEPSSTPIERMIAAFEALRQPGMEPLAQLAKDAREQYERMARVTTPQLGARRYYCSEKLNGSDHAPEVEDRVECPLSEANLVGSLCADGKHLPVLDVDWPVQVVRSSTPGHHHLYLGIPPMTTEAYFELLQALGKAHVLSDFYVKASVIRGQSFVRLPWVKKPPRKEMV